MTKEEKITELTKLITPEGFKGEIQYADDIWRADPELFDWIFSKMNFCTSEMIKALEKNAPGFQLKSILSSHLRGFRRSDFDTEDAEFITECFAVVSHIAGVRFGDRAMRWLYGIPVWLLLKVMRFFRPEKTLAVKQESCENCGVAFSIALKQRGSQRESEWIIGQCLSCGSYNLTETFPDSRETSFTNFQPREYLVKTEYSEEQALTRLEQIRYWRK